MKRSLLLLLLTLIIPLLLDNPPAAGAEYYQPSYVQVPDRWSYELLTPEELDDLLAPIALYPDPLVAQILPAATFVDEVAEAARFVRRYGTARVDYQPWDISVRAVAHYPRLLYMMEREYQWTAALGQAFIEQPDDVMDAVQRLRDYAWAQGNLYSTREQEVIYEAGIIRIVPARPRYIYIPVYDPYVVYYDRYSPSYPFITFSVGFTIGAWLNRDCDWRERRVYYHGWRGPRWVTRSRPHIRDRRDIYITPRASTINLNRRVVQRDTRGYREQLRTEGLRRREGGRIPQSRIRTEQPRPGRIERPRTLAPVEPRTGTTEQQRIRREQQRQTPSGVIEPVRPGRMEQRRPGITGQPRGTVVQPPGATGQQRRPAREGQGQGEGRRRELRQINRPPAPQTPSGISPPQAPPRVIETPSRAPVVVPPAPSIPTPPSVTPAPPTIAPAPATPATPSPRATEPAPAREDSGRGRGYREDSGREAGDPSRQRAPGRER